MHLRPSKAHIWTRCAAAPSFESRVPEEPPSDEAREGTCAAWVADAVLKGDATHCVEMVGKTHPNGWLVTPDMAEHVQKYVDAVQADGGLTTTEAFVRLSEFIAGTLDSSTTCGDGVLRVRDLKYGYAIVEPTTPQLTIYAGAEMYRLLNAGAIVSRVELVIHQPRAYHAAGPIRARTLTPQELHAECLAIVEAGNRCQAPEPIATPGDHCRHCNAKLTCHAFLTTMYAAADVVSSDTRQRKMTPEELRDYWRFLDRYATLMSSAKKAIDAEIETRLRQGAFVPGMYLKPSYGHRRFTVAPEVVHFLTGVDPHKRVLMTPAELEREGAPVDIVNALSKSQEIGRKVDSIPDGYFAKVFGVTS